MFKSKQFDVNRICLAIVARVHFLQLFKSDQMVFGGREVTDCISQKLLKLLFQKIKQEILENHVFEKKIINVQKNRKNFLESGPKLFKSHFKTKTSILHFFFQFSNDMKCTSYQKAIKDIIELFGTRSQDQTKARST